MALSSFSARATRSLSRENREAGRVWHVHGLCISCAACPIDS